MKIGLYGGTFDPIHLGHLIQAENAREKAGLDRVRFIPAADPPHKDRPQTPGKLRLEMVQKAIEGNPYFELSDIEFRLPQPSYTIKTIDALRAKEPETEFVFIFGEDSLHQVHLWYDYETLLKRLPFVVFRRSKDDSDLEILAKKYRAQGARIQIIDAPWIDISSTDIRNRVAEGSSIRYRVSEGVRQTILAKDLYRR